MCPTKGKGTGLLETFENLDRETKISLSEISKPSELAVAALFIAKGETGITELSAEHIEACLEMAGVDVTRQSLRNSLSRATGIVKSWRVGPDTFYRIMTKGELIAERVLANGNLQVVQVKASTPRTSRKYLDNILSDLRGTVRICDPYYGHKTFDSLDKIPKSTKVRFLTSRTSESGAKLRRTIASFRKEFALTQLMEANASAKIHDRYITDGKQLMLVGHGLKDIGNGDSFIIIIGSHESRDLIRQVIKTFDEHWRAARPL
jgi:hypothetical protein